MKFPALDWRLTHVLFLILFLSLLRRVLYAYFFLYSVYFLHWHLQLYFRNVSMNTMVKTHPLKGRYTQHWDHLMCYVILRRGMFSRRGLGGSGFTHASNIRCKINKVKEMYDWSKVRTPIIHICPIHIRFREYHTVLI